MDTKNKSFLAIDLNDQSAINHLFAYNCLSPITKPEEMLGDKTVQWTEPNIEWQKWIDQQPWGRNYRGDDSISFQQMELRDKLLSFGGSEVCILDIEEDCDDILEHGQLWYGDHVIKKKGTPSQCHYNSACLYEVNQSRNVLDTYRQRITICTGYALSEDGLWRQHSWCVLRTSRTVKVVETTEKRALYFGFAMTTDRAEKFCYDNS